MAHDYFLLQRNLIALGYPCGIVDGDIGPKSRRSILEFRTDWKVAEGYDAVMVALDAAMDGRLPMPELSQITPERLRRFAPRSNYNLYAPILNRQCLLHRITTPRRVRQFMAQIGKESAELTVFEENLRYRDPVRLDEMFSAIRGTADARALIAKGPQAIANRAYANRGGNGNEASGDGWKYRGMGPMQVTFRNNYELASNWTGVNLVRNPERMLEPEIGVRAACGFWASNGINLMVDQDDDETAIGNISQHLRLNEEDDVRAATRTVNGPALKGLADRRELLQRAGQIWMMP